MKDQFILFLGFVILLFGGTALFLSGELFGDKKDVEGVGVVVFDKVMKTYSLLNLPECSFVGAAEGGGIVFVNDEYPTAKYRLEGGFNFDTFTGKWVEVKGRAETMERLMRPPEIVCMQGRCEAPIREEVLHVEDISLEDKSFSKCQMEWLERNHPASI